jgi:hypothetical protein
MQDQLTRASEITVSETKDDIAAERDQLRAENETLRNQLAATAQPAGAAQPQHRFFLSEGDRQALELQGWVSIGGRVFTADDVRKALVGTEQEGVEIADPPADATVPTMPVRGPAVLGVTHVYPSVEPGKIDPALLGFPGINQAATPDVPADDTADKAK